MGLHRFEHNIGKIYDGIYLITLRRKYLEYQNCPKHFDIEELLVDTTSGQVSNSYPIPDHKYFGTRLMYGI